MLTAVAHRLGLGFWIVLAAFGCRSDVEVISRCALTSSRLVATIYSISGGGAAGWVELRVDLSDPNDPLDPDSYAFAITHAYELGVEQLGPRHILINYPSSSDSVHFSPVYGTQDGSFRIDVAPVDSADGGIKDEAKKGCRQLKLDLAPDPGLNSG